MGNHHIEPEKNNHIRILDILQWFSRYTFKEYCDNLNQILPHNKTSAHIKVNETNVKNFLHKLSSIRKNKHPYPMNILLLCSNLENTSTDNNLYHLHNFLSLGIIFCTRNKKNKSNNNHNMNYLMHMLKTTPLFIDAFINELLKMLIQLLSNSIGSNMLLRSLFSFSSS